MTDDVRISTGLRHHRKTKRLRRLLGGEGCWALVCLFLWAGEERWTGDLGGLTDDDIEEEADWNGVRGALIAALIEVGFLAGEAGERVIHDWQEHNPYAATKGQRIEKGKRAAAARWDKHAISNATSMPGACKEDASSNALGQCPPAPAPAPTSPSLRSGERTRKRVNLKPAQFPLPDGFVVSDRVRKWALGKGFDRLDEHFESFVSKARAKGYVYTDWDEALMSAVRDDWAGLRSNNARAGPPNASPPSKTLTAIQTLQSMKSNANMDPQRDSGRPEQVALLGPGTYSGC